MLACRNRPCPKSRPTQNRLSGCWTPSGEVRLFARPLPLTPFFNSPTAGENSHGLSYKLPTVKEDVEIRLLRGALPVELSIGPPRPSQTLELGTNPDYFFTLEL